MFSDLKQSVNTKFNHWLDRRIPLQKTINLNQRSIFVFLSIPGRWFAGLLLVMLVAAINYQNNMMFALVFLLASVFIITILHTFANLSGLTVSSGKPTAVFAGDTAEFEIVLARKNDAAYFDIQLSWPESETCLLSLISNSSEVAYLHVPVKQRGWYRPPRLLVETFYPLGLLRCWSWLALDVKVLVYPQPQACPLPVAGVESDEGEGELAAVVGSDEFHEFKSYQLGDPLKHVFWKGYAKGQTLQTKQFAAYRDRRLWLNVDDFAGDLEQRLSQLCYWVIKLEQSDEDYGLKLGNISIDPSHGEQHQQRLLKALALFGTEES